MTMQLFDGDATFTKSFTKVAFGDDTGIRYNFGFKAQKGKQFVVMLLGEVDAKATDCDLEKMLNDLGFYRKEGSQGGE